MQLTRHLRRQTGRMKPKLDLELDTHLHWPYKRLQVP